MTKVQEQVVYELFVKQNAAFSEIMDYDSFLDCLRGASVDEIFEIIVCNRNELEEIQTRNIPQFSEKRDMYKALKVLVAAEAGSLSYHDLGYYLCKIDRKAEAKRKYAENQYMLAVQMGFAVDGKPLAVTPFGRAFNAIPDERTKDEIMKRMCLKVPVIQQILLAAQNERVDVVSYLSTYLAPSTVLRRRSNIHTFLNWLRSVSNEGLIAILNRITW